MTNITKLKIGGTEYSIDYNSLANKYSLPTASTSTLGGVKVDGSTITITDGVISASGSGSGGADTNLSNLTTTGKSVITGASVPASSGYTGLTLESGAEYTAPSDGWFTAGGTNDTSATALGYIQFNNRTRQPFVQSTYVVNTGTVTLGWGLTMYCKKDDVIKVEYTRIGTVNYFGFIPAAGV